MKIFGKNSVKGVCDRTMAVIKKILLVKTLVPMIAVFIALGMALFAFSNKNTFSWFSNNKDVSATGMQVTVDSTANITIITAEELTSETLQKETTLIPCTYINGEYVDLVSHNTAYVNQSKGTVEPGATYKPVSNNGDKKYFADYTIKLGASGKAFNYSDVTVTIDGEFFKADGTTKTTLTESPYLKAATVAVYLGDSVAKGEYKGKLSAENFNGSITLLENGTIGTGDTDKVSVTLRCYFDGALGDATGTYIKTSSVDASKIALNVYFTAVESTSST